MVGFEDRETRTMQPGKQKKENSLDAASLIENSPENTFFSQY